MARTRTHTADGRRISSMTHARRVHTCPGCGRRSAGNGGHSSHQRACKAYRERYGVYVTDAERQSLLQAGYDSTEIRDMALRAAQEGRDRLQHPDDASRDSALTTDQEKP